jgi:hypothetical protein
VLYSEKTLTIPTEFTLFGHKYKIVLEKDLITTESAYGTASEDLKLIRLQDVGDVLRTYTDEDGKKENVKLTITDETVIETFFHEITHIILSSMGDDKLSENEKLVNIMGKAWLEIYLSLKYEKDSNKKEV